MTRIDDISCILSTLIIIDEYISVVRLEVSSVTSMELYSNPLV